MDMCKEAGMELEEERHGVAGGAAWSRRRNGLETQEEWLGVAGGAAWSHKRSPPEIKEELPGVANFVPACFPPFYYSIY